MQAAVSCARNSQTSAAMARGESASPKRVPYFPLLPDDLMYVIFFKLDFRDKVNAGLVCKQWDQLLKAGTAPAKHWEVEYRVKESQSWNPSPLEPERQTPISQQPAAVIVRYVTERPG
jgi:hypothetical protein